MYCGGFITNSRAEFNNCESLPITLPDKHFVGSDAIWGREEAAQAYLFLSSKQVDERVGTLLEIGDHLNIEGQNAHFTVPSETCHTVDSIFLLLCHAERVSFSHLEEKWAHPDQVQIKLNFTAYKTEKFEE